MELIIQDQYHTMQCQIYLKDQQGSKTVIIGYDGKNLIQQVVSEGESKEFLPLLTFPMNLKEHLIAAFVAEANKMNLKTDGENTLQGKLGATEKHLDDMRGISTKLLDFVTKHVEKI